VDKSGKTVEGRWEHPAFFAIFDQTDRIAALQQRHTSFFKTTNVPHCIRIGINGNMKQRPPLYPDYPVNPVLFEHA
jgi:hypothetical protein